MERLTRLTTDVPKDNIENALNLFYAKDGWTWIRSGGPAPDYADMPLHDFVRMLVKPNIPEVELPEDNDALSDLMCDWLTYDPDSAEGIISLLYTVGWAFAELRHRLAAYEDTGLEPEEVNRCKLTLMGKSLAEITEFDGVSIERLKELARADKEGRLVGLPCKVGDTVYISGHEYAAQIYEIVIKANGGITFFWLEYDRGPELEELWDYGEFTPEDIGKTVFLTREEAERALEEGAE